MGTIVNRNALEREILNLLARVEILRHRILLDTGTVRATAPMLRGAWGRALHQLDLEAYRQVFEGRRANNANDQSPLYVVRPAPPNPAFSPAFDWILVGHANRFESTLFRAWTIASEFGLGSKREPFSIRQVKWLDACSHTGTDRQSWHLSNAAENTRGEFAGGSPLQLIFNSPLRLIRNGKLIERPTFADIALALSRRLFRLCDEENRESIRELTNTVVDEAKRLPADAWQGKRSDFIRWSGTQQRPLDLHGVSGVNFVASRGGILVAATFRRALGACG